MQSLHKKKASTKRMLIGGYTSLIRFFTTCTSLVLYLANAVSAMQISPASTLEPSFEALNVKKFDGMFQAFSHCASVEFINSIMGLKLQGHFICNYSCLHGGSSIPSDHCSV